MDYDREKVEEVVMALLSLTMFSDQGGTRAWKGHDWSVMDALHEKGWIGDPKSAAKSVLVTDRGIDEARKLFEKHFGRA